MPTFILPLANIISDPDSPIDFVNLSPDEALFELLRVYEFLGPNFAVAIDDDTVTLTLPEPHPFAQAEADRQTKRAQRAAEKGNYAAAISAYEEVLRTLPSDSTIRRDLAMAHMEVGNAAAARTEVIRVLRLDPDDPWAYLLLGNIALRFGDDRTRALSYFQRAYRLAPDDLYILNSYGALCGKEGDLAEAEALFERALAIDPAYPNARHGLALTYHRQERLKDAEAQLRLLFTSPHSADIRTEPVYAQGRNLYVLVQRDLARNDHNLLMDRLRADADDLGRATGYPIRWQEESQVDLVAAKTELAWVHGRSEHLIRYVATDTAILPHRIAHELEHIRLVHEARLAGRNRHFTSTPATLAHARRLVAQDRHKLRSQALPESAIDEYMEMIIRGLTSQVLNNPLDMAIESRIRQQYDYLYASQFASLHNTLQEAAQVLSDRFIRERTPQVVYDANVTMNAAYALFADDLFAGFTDYAGPYRRERQFNQGRKLYQVWQKRGSALQPGDEYDLVDAFAAVLGLRNWYIWQPDEVLEPSLDADVWEDIDVDAAEAEGREAEAELLRQKEPATLMYLLGAMERFDKLTAQDVSRVTAEIAMLGQTGLDYASSDRKYTLPSFPDEQFTGLQLMCLMYVGLKRTSPDLDPGMPFDEAYRMAMGLHGK